MSFTNAKLLNESFLRIHLNENVDSSNDKTMSLDDIDTKINNCKTKLISIKEKYDDIKSTWKALCEDKASYAFNQTFASVSISESFNKAIEDLKLEYEDTKNTLAFYKDIKNKALLEANVQIPDDQLMDPSTTISLKKLAAEATKQEKEAEEKAQRTANAKPLLDAINNIEATNSEEFFNELFSLLVPESGKADTQAGELVRAIGKILYRDWNDGDKFYQGYGLEVVGPAAAFLMENGYWDDVERILDHVTGDDAYDSDRYTKAIEALRDKIAEDVQDIDLLTQPPVSDMLDSDTSWLEENQPRYETEIWVSDDLDRHIDERNVSSDEIIEYIEEALSWDNAYRDAEVTSWGHWGDREFTVSNLTIDGRDQLEDTLKRHLDSFWQDLVNELNEKYPEESDDDFEDDDYDEENLDEAFLTEAVLMETGDEDNLQIFMELYNDSNPMKARVDRTLDAYRDYEDELPEDLFKKASTADQARIIELLQK